MLLFGIVLIIIVVIILYLVFYHYKVVENYAVDSYLTTYPTNGADELSVSIANANTLNNQLKTDIDNIDIFSTDKDKEMLLLKTDIENDVGKYAIIRKLSDIYFKYLEIFDITNLNDDYNIIPMININLSEDYVIDDDLIYIEKYLENNVYNNNLSPAEYVKNIPKSSLAYTPPVVTIQGPTVPEIVIDAPIIKNTPTDALIQSSQVFGN